jgi:hypothetical protein
MVATTPPVLVEKPTPSLPLRYGLITAAVGPLDLPVHARAGGTKYVDSLCARGFPYEPECPPSALNSKTSFFGTGTETVTGVPFVIGATVTCGTVGYTYDEQRAFVMERLKSVEQGELELAFSTGAVNLAPSLTAAAGIITVTGAGDTITDVLGELERARYCGFGANTAKYGPPGYLHVAIPVFERLKENHLIEFDGTRWRTAIGTVVSTGCYANNDPAGAAPADGVFWMYITGQTTIWRTPDSAVSIAPVEGSLNRATNQLLMLAEREYVISYECGGFAKSVILWT